MILWVLLFIMNRQRERVPRGTGTPKDTDEINRREVYECDGWVCVLEVINVPSRFVCLLWINKGRSKDKSIHWVTRGTGTPKDKEEVNRRDACECDGCVCVLEVIDDPSIFKMTRNTVALVRVLPTFVFRFKVVYYKSKARVKESMLKWVSV